MTKLGVSFGVVALAFLGPPAAARAAGGPLLVVVEATPGADIAPADVRRAVAAELGPSVVSPRDARAADADRLMVVVLDGAAIRVTLRESSSPLVTRTIPAPPSRPARLQAIAWLAGNVARDQVIPIVEGLPAASVAAEPPPPATETPPGPTGPSMEPPPLRQPAVEPPSSSSGGRMGTSRSEAISATSSERGTQSAWTITASAGPALLPFPSDPTSRSNAVSIKPQGTIYEVRVERSAHGGGLNLGLALDVGDLWNISGGGRNVIALAGLAGTRREHRGWFVELSGGVGLAAISLPTEHRTVTNSSTTGATDTLTTTNDYGPVLFATGRGGIGVSVSRSFDLLAELGVSLGSAGLEADYVSTTVGARLRLP